MTKLLSNLDELYYWVREQYDNLQFEMSAKAGNEAFQRTLAIRAGQMLLVMEKIEEVYLSQRLDS